MMVTLPEDIDPDQYKEFIYMYSRGSKLMHAEANTAIYVTLEASLIFWKNFT